MYGLDKTIYDKFIIEPSLFLALSLDAQEKIFVLPKEKIIEIFEGQLTIKRPNRDTDRWMIRIKKFDGSNFLKIDHSDISHVLDIYLNKWNQIPDFQQLNTENVTEKMFEIAIESNDVFTVKKVLTGEHVSERIHRIGQNRIREHILVNYNNQCALCEVNEADLLIASHIVPWSETNILRGVLNNVICLCVLHDIFFESGKLVIADDYSVSLQQRNI